MATESTNGLATAATRRLAGAPISWGVCEVPAWGLQLPPERVLSEMASLGLRATELGPVGWLPLDPERIREALGSHGLRLVAGFVPLVLHESADVARDEAARVADGLAKAGAELFVAAAVVDAAWSPRIPLDDAARRRVNENLAMVDEIVSERGLQLALHPHAGTLVETAEDLEPILDGVEIGWCLDTGHYLIGGIDSADFVRENFERIVHVHLKDVDAGLAARVRAGELSLVEATQAGLFRPLGQGDARIEEVVELLDRHGYERWLVLEQDTALTGEEPPVGSGPILDVQTSIEYLGSLAPAQRGGIPQP
jgi:inosose dehydratase